MRTRVAYNGLYTMLLFNAYIKLVILPLVVKWPQLQPKQ